MQSTTIAVDLAKNVFQIAVSRRPGQVSESHRVSRGEFARFFAERQPALVLMEACGTSHFWARQIESLGHRVVLLPPHAVRPYVQRSKTDKADAKALLEAHRNQDIHPVPVKTVSQQTLATLHRLRSSLMADRTARINQVRGLLREFGVYIPVGVHHVVPHVRAAVEQGDRVVPAVLHEHLAQICDDITGFTVRIKGFEKQLEALARQIPEVQRLRSIPGVGLLTATALVALVGDARRFPTSRHFASYLGLTPREHSSGARRRLGRISKCGDVYLRMLLNHGARSALRAAQRLAHPDRLRAWGLELKTRLGTPRATVALANKLARIIWAVWRQGGCFESRSLVS